MALYKFILPDKVAEKGGLLLQMCALLKLSYRLLKDALPKPVEVEAGYFGEAGFSD
jgi:hypothetical protein